MLKSRLKLKRLDCSLVTNKSFSKTLPSNGLGSRPGEVDNVAKTSSIDDITHKKNKPLNHRNFLIHMV